MNDAYRVETVDSLGPLGSQSLLDTPFSVSVLPEALLRNSQAVNFKEASKYLPLVSYQEQQGPDILRPQTRGMQGGNFQNSRIDGMTAFVRDYRAILADLVPAYGDTFCLGSPPFIPTIGFARGGPGFTNQSRPGFAAFVTGNTSPHNATTWLPITALSAILSFLT